jgi:hypothetical protein
MRACTCLIGWADTMSAFMLLIIGEPGSRMESFPEMSASAASAEGDYRPSRRKPASRCDHIIAGGMGVLRGASLRGQWFDRLRRPGIPAGLLRLGKASGLRLGVMSDHRLQAGTDGPDSVNRAGRVRIANPE